MKKKSPVGRTGAAATRERIRLHIIVRAGKANWWVPLRPLNEAIEKAGI